MKQVFKLMAVLAHPDDESLGFGGTLARYAAEGIETYLVTATRGERGRFGSRGKDADPVEVGRIRELELRAAAAVLGIGEVFILGYGDGEVDQLDSTIAIRAIVEHIGEFGLTWLSHSARTAPTVIRTTSPSRSSRQPLLCALAMRVTAVAFFLLTVLPSYNLAWRNVKWEGMLTRSPMVRP